MHTLERFFMSSLLCSQGCSRTLWLWSLFSAYDTITSSAFLGGGEGGLVVLCFFSAGETSEDDGVSSVSLA